MLYKVAVIGDLPEYDSISSKESVQCKVEHIIDIIQYQYGHNLVINAAGHPHVGIFAAKKCLADNIKFHLFMPCPIEEMDEVFYGEQQADLQNVFTNAWSTTISSSNYTTGPSLYHGNYKNLVDNSAFVICLWSGRKQGEVHAAMSYALSASKLLIDGMDDLKLMTKSTIYGPEKIEGE